jgi:uncharacterized protein RhaS with RHS repeats
MWLPEASLYNFKARDYSPSLGRFMQTDPILFGGGLNIYAYVGNDPVNATDPLGLNDPNIPEIVPGGRRTHLPPCPAGEECITVTAPFRIIGDIGAIEVFGHLPEADEGGSGAGVVGRLIKASLQRTTLSRCQLEHLADAFEKAATVYKYTALGLAVSAGIFGFGEVFTDGLDTPGTAYFAEQAAITAGIGKALDLAASRIRSQIDNNPWPGVSMTLSDALGLPETGSPGADRVIDAMQDIAQQSLQEANCAS